MRNQTLLMCVDEGLHGEVDLAGLRLGLLEEVVQEQGFVNDVVVVFEQFFEDEEVVVDVAERGVDFVRDARDHLPEGGHFFGMDEAHLRGGQVVVGFFEVGGAGDGAAVEEFEVVEEADGEDDAAEDESCAVDEEVAAEGGLRLFVRAERGLRLLGGGAELCGVVCGDAVLYAGQDVGGRRCGGRVLVEPPAAGDGPGDEQAKEEGVDDFSHGNAGWARLQNVEDCT